MNNKTLRYGILGLAALAIVLTIAFQPKLIVPVVAIAAVLFGLTFIPLGGSARQSGNATQPQSGPSNVFQEQRLMAEILAMTGSRTVAKRLIENYRYRFPQQSEQWRREKILYDLKRDKGSI